MSLLTQRKITHAEAKEAQQRLVNSHFHNPDHARISIPARPDYDDDLVLAAYIEQQRLRDEADEGTRMVRDDRLIGGPQPEAVAHFAKSGA